jgi:hypothetical protein
MKAAEENFAYNYFKLDLPLHCGGYISKLILREFDGKFSCGQTDMKKL